MSPAHSPRRGVHLAGRILGALLLVHGLAAAEGAGPLPEYEVKAGFLFHFARFVEWPERAGSRDGKPLVIGVVDAPEVAETLTAALAGRRIDGRPVEVRGLRGTLQAGGCDIVFLPGADPRRIGSLLAGLEGKPLLTVTESGAPPWAGGVINFRLEGSKVRFEIDTLAAERAGLRVSSKLLGVATAVRTTREARRTP